MRTHFIVGFPTETEYDFLQSLKAIDEVDFDLVIPATYHNCPDTVASSMSGQIPAFTKYLRFSRMLTRILLNLYLNRLRFNSYNKASKIKNAENKK
jgi:tRNA-2-methylthio-N6-dimethylallyladenosine synthase